MCRAVLSAPVRWHGANGKHRPLPPSLASSLADLSRIASQEWSVRPSWVELYPARTLAGRSAVPCDQARYPPVESAFLEEPDGWFRFPIGKVDRGKARGYHGTVSSSVRGILRSGVRPGPNASRVYASPSLWVASNPAYAPFFPMGKRWGQVVVELRLPPGSWEGHHMTLDHSRWDRGVRCDPAGVEWALTHPGDAAVSALLLRQLGPGAPREFGELAGLVRNVGVEGPNSHWAGMLLGAMREGGYRTDPEDALNREDWLEEVGRIEREHEAEWRGGHNAVCGQKAPSLPWNR
eukprot:Hpha_TRINITY_DN15710_c0_g1::TRINITY_DN15710_c0_g1_i1::g.41634::m.41634